MDIPAITEARRVATPRLTTRGLFAGPKDGVPVLFVHGNFSGATRWEETILRLPGGFQAIAPDLRGYGGADPTVRIDATRGMGDLSDDLWALMDALGIEPAHLVGHSLGGTVLWRFLADHPGRVLSLTQVNPASPWGFGGTRADGRRPGRSTRPSTCTCGGRALKGACVHHTGRACTPEEPFHDDFRALVMKVKEQDISPWLAPSSASSRTAISSTMSIRPMLGGR